MQRLACDLRHGDEILRPQVVDRLEQHVADHGRLLAGLDVHALDLLDRAFPVVAESHLPRRLLHLLFLPREFLVGEGDELLRRVRNHLVREIHDEAGTAAGSARNAGVVGLARRIGLGDEVEARNLALACILDEEIVDLPVAAQGIEVERLERRHPVEIELPRPSASRAARGPASATPAAHADEALDDRAHLVLRQRDDLLEVRDFVVFDCRHGPGARRGHRRRSRNQIGWRDLVAQETGVVAERGVDLLVRHAHPPREEGIVGVVEVEPGRDAVAQAVNGVSAARREVLAHLQRVGSRRPSQSRLRPAI